MTEYSPIVDINMTTDNNIVPLPNNSKDRANSFFVNTFDTNFYTNDPYDYGRADNVSQTCHLIVNPAHVSRNKFVIQPVVVNSNDHLLPSTQVTEKQSVFSSRIPSNIGYQTFKNENSPFGSPLKRSSTFAGVFGSLFKHPQSDYNHLSTEQSLARLENKQPTNKRRLHYSQSNYGYDESRFTLSEPLRNDQSNGIVTARSLTSLLPNLIDIQNIRQSLVSMAVVLTKHSSSNIGRILEPQSNNSVKEAPFHNSLSIPNSLPNSSSTASATSSSSSPSSSSLYTNNEASTVVALQEDLPSFNLNFCTLCLQYNEPNEFITLDACKCGFCRPCLEQYCTIIIRDHSLTSSQITCPSSDCPHSNSYITPEQIRQLVDKATFKLYEKIKLDLEVHLDPNRVWCPRPNCETVCSVSTTAIDKIETSSSLVNSSKIDMTLVQASPSNVQKSDRRVPVNCKNCNLTFCLHCRSSYHGKMPCQSPSEDESLSLLLSRTRTPNSLNEYIKKCPKCGIFIERDRGCAQMMCQKCKHVFCWFCLSSLEEDFLLRHYDSGSCKNKLGHSKGTLLWLRFQVIAVFLGFALFLLLVSPLLLISGPILLIAHYFCNLSISTKVWTKDDFPDVTEQNRKNAQQSRRTSDKVSTGTDENQSSSNQLIDLSDSNEKLNNDESPANKHQQLIQAYIQNNGTHKIMGLDQSLSLDDNNAIDFEEQPIQLSGYDRDAEQKNEQNGNKLFSWFRWKKTKPDPPPRLSSMLDVEKHRKFMEELMADKQSLDNQLNGVEIDKHYMIISKPPESDDQQQDTAVKTPAKWLSFWKSNS